MTRGVERALSRAERAGHWPDNSDKGMRGLWVCRRCDMVLTGRARRDGKGWWLPGLSTDLMVDGVVENPTGRECWRHRFFWRWWRNLRYAMGLRLYVRAEWYNTRH